MAVYNVKWTIVEIKQLKMICVQVSRAAAKSSNVNYRYTWLESSTACSTPLILNRNIISSYWDMHTCSITHVCTCMCQPTHSLCVPAHTCKHTYGVCQRGSAAVLFHNISLSLCSLSAPGLPGLAAVRNLFTCSFVTKLFAYECSQVNRLSLCWHSAVCSTSLNELFKCLL